MSRIQDILNKAEREGAVRRTRVGAEASEPRVFVENVHIPSPPPATRRPVAPAAPPAPASEPAVVQAGTISPLLVAALDPHAPAAEQYRTLRTRRAAAESGAPRVLAVSSPCVGDGKSITAVNLALTMAQEVNRRVVLVDADLRRPSVHTLLGLPHRPGLAAVLTGEVPLEEAIVELPEYQLAVVTSGMPPEHPAELLGSAAMRRVLDALRSRFDRVVLDTPPAVPLADVGVLAPMTDGVVLVVRAASTTRPTIERAMAVLDQGRLLGLVLNATGGDQNGYGYYGARQPS